MFDELFKKPTVPLLHCINTHACLAWQQMTQENKDTSVHHPAPAEGNVFLDSDTSRRLEYVHYCFKEGKNK